MKKTPHVIWACPTSQAFFRSKGEVRCRPGSVIPKLIENGIKVNVLIPYDPLLLPKTKLSAGRVTRHTVSLGANHSVKIIKLTRGSVSPGIYMADFSANDAAIAGALLSRAALLLAAQIKKPVDIFHSFGWETALLPLYLETEGNGARIFKNTHTFLTVSSVHEQGNFSPRVLDDIGIPKKIFHPEGVEFFGKVSYLKAGFLFAEAVGLIEGGVGVRQRHVSRNGTGFEGVLEAHSHKVRRWASERSLKSFMDAYKELLAMPGRQSLMPRLMKKSHSSEAAADNFISTWGPVPPDRYSVTSVSFLAQSPTKAFAFWEWPYHDYTDYGLILEDLGNGSRVLLSRGLHALADFWMDVTPDHEYVVELVGWNHQGGMQPLLRSKPLQIPRKMPSVNREATFIDVRTRARFKKMADGVGDFSPLGSSSLGSSLVLK